MAIQLEEMPVLEVEPRRPGPRRLAVALVLGAVAAAGLTLTWASDDHSSPVYVAPQDCEPVVGLRPDLEAALGTGWRLGETASIRSGHPGYEQLYYVAARVTPSGEDPVVAVWAANFSDGGLPAGEHSSFSFVPVNAAAEATGIAHGVLDPPRSDPAILEAQLCLPGANG
jgi:hypothetical protein